MKFFQPKFCYLIETKFWLFTEEIYMIIFN